MKGEIGFAVFHARDCKAEYAVGNEFIFAVDRKCFFRGAVWRMPAFTEGKMHVQCVALIS